MATEGAMAQMPRYQSHKRVWALKIAAVDGYRVSFSDPGFAPIECPAPMFARGKPVPGDYLVEYEGDGYRSFSPGKAFEEGYTSLDAFDRPANERIARVCHEVNRALCIAFGDHSQKPWDEAEQWQRDSAMKGVSYAIRHPEGPVSAQHDAWSADKLADGWVYGGVKDAEAKTHPCLVAFDRLPPEQKAKDYLFKAVVAAMLPRERLDGQTLRPGTPDFHDVEGKPGWRGHDFS